MGTEANLPLYAKNIKYLRKKSGLTQVQLGIKLNIANNTISQYEKGRRGTANDVLKIFADYFHVSVQDLLFKDLQEESAKKDIRIGVEKIIQLINLLFPLVDSEAALQNENFCKGYQYSADINKYSEDAISGLVAEINRKKKKANTINDVKEMIQEVFGRGDTDYTQKYLSISYDYFRKVEDEKIKDVVAANILRILFFRYVTLKPNTNNVSDISEDGEIVYSFDMNNTPIDVNTIKKHNDFSEKYLQEIFDNIQILKTSNQLSELGDYYLSVVFVMNMFPYEEGEDIQTTAIEFAKTGYGMMLAYYLIDNKYAANFYDFMESIGDI